MDKLFECNDAGLFEAVHYPADFELYVSAKFYCELVFVHDFIGYECEVDVDLLVVIIGVPR